MKLTLFEKNIIYTAIGAVNHAHISELEVLLSLRDRLKLSHNETEIIKNGKDADKHKIIDVELSDHEKKIVWNKLNEPIIKLPVRKESLLLINKFKPKST